MSDKKEINELPWPDDEPPPSAEELAQAARLAEDLEQALDTGAPAAEMSEELAAAVMLRAAEGQEQGLGSDRARELVSASLEQAPARRRRALRAAPVLAVAAAALLALGALLAIPAMKQMDAPRRNPAPETLSRSSDALMARPFARREAASSRLDRVFADRMRGYRKVVLASRGGQP